MTHRHDITHSKNAYVALTPAPTGSEHRGSSLRWLHKKRTYHSLLFDLCYCDNAFCILYLWVFPKNETLWIACYLLVHGSFASAVITWKLGVSRSRQGYLTLHPHLPTTCFYRHPPLYPNAVERFPAAVTSKIHPANALFMSAVMYIVWQGLHRKFVLVNQKKKFDSGQRATSFTHLLNDKRGVIGRMLKSVKEVNRIPGFMAGQLDHCYRTPSGIFCSTGLGHISPAHVCRERMERGWVGSMSRSLDANSNES